MGLSAKPVKRRMWAAGGKSWHALLDAAEAVLREDGYAALSSRNISNRAGVNQQLLYYYFRSMDDLVIAAFRRLADREIAELDAAAASSRPLHAIWEIRSSSSNLNIVPEFSALAKRIEGLRKQFVEHLNAVWRIQITALRKSIGERDLPAIELSAPALVILLDTAAQTLTRQGQFGNLTGHAEFNSAFDAFLAALEPDEPA